MEVLLPAKSSSLGALEKELTPGHWTDWQARYAPRPGSIELPRFELKATYRLNEPLQALGMIARLPAGGLAINGHARGARRAWRPRRRAILHFIGAAIGFLEGGRGRLRSRGRHFDRHPAAAVVRQPPPFQMIVDRPFFCAIEDRRSGALLFVGAIFDPSP